MPESHDLHIRPLIPAWTAHSDRNLLHPAIRRMTGSARLLLCAGLIAAVGCSQDGGGKYRKKTADEQLAEIRERFPVTPPDTPEQIQQKEATVEETLPQVYAMLEEAKTDPTKVDEVVELSMSLLTLVPGHRAAKAAYCRAQLASFFAREAADPYNAWIAINSAVLEIDRLRENFDDLSEDELQLCQEVYFNMARREGYFPHGENAPTEFKDAIDKLMSSGFRDVERLRKEPKFEYFFTDPKFAPVLQAAIAQLETSPEDIPVASDTSEDEAPPQPE